MQKISEGLRQLELKDLVNPLFEIDAYSSKMGEDQDVCVVSFSVNDRMSAKDLMEFIEKGYNFVLDSDVSSGENKDGKYFVFIELDRNQKLAEQIQEILYGVKKLTGIDDWKYKYHKKTVYKDADLENLRQIPTTPSMYESYLNEVKSESLKSFFNKTLMDDLTLNDSMITIHKPFNQKIKLLIIDEEPTILEGAPLVDENSTAEIFWLTKVLGNYDISKFGDKFLFSNESRQILLQRVD